MAHAAGTEESWSGRLEARAEHHASDIMMVAIAGVAGVGLRPLPGLFNVTVPVTLFVVVVLAFLMMRAHDRRLCEQCAAAIPADPGLKAKRLRFLLWMAHAGSDPGFFVPYLVILCSSGFATTTLQHQFAAVMQLTMILLVLAQRVHRQLQPWCPKCSEGGGGEEVDDLPPVLPHDDRQLV